MGVPCFLSGCWGGVSLLLLIMVGGSRPRVPLSPLSDLSTCRAVGYVLLRKALCSCGTPVTAACRQLGSASSHLFTVVACLVCSALL